jgi:hypothetical protein
VCWGFTQVCRTTRTSDTVSIAISRLPKKSSILNLCPIRYPTHRLWPVLDIPCRSSCPSVGSRVHAHRCPHSTAQPQRFSRYIDKVCLCERDISCSINYCGHLGFDSLRSSKLTWPLALLSNSRFECWLGNCPD